VLNFGFFIFVFSLMGFFSGSGFGLGWITEPRQSSIGSSECTSSALSQNILDNIEKNRAIYQKAAKAEGINWEMLAAIHYREGSNNPNQSLMSGEKIGTKNPDTGKIYHTLEESAIAAARSLKSRVSSLTTSSSNETIKLAFLGHNRGNMYKLGGCTPDQSPYVMNQFDAAHINMRWPDNACEIIPATRNRPARATSVKGKIEKNRLGAFTVYSILRGAITGATTCTEKVSAPITNGKTALPINPSAILGYNNSLHDCSISNPGSCNSGGHRVILGSLSTLGTSMPKRIGEGVDLRAKGGTPVYAPFDGKVVYASTRSALGETGGYIAIQSTDGKNAAVLAHIVDYPTRGTTVTAGQQVGKLKTYNGAFGPHLHFELWTNKAPVNAGGPGSGVTPKKIWDAQKKALGF